MDMLIGSRTVNRIVELIRENSDLFVFFESVYLFGSVLNDNIIPNDLDILLVYEGDAMGVLDGVNSIKMIFEKEIGLYVDLTVLSSEEVIETDFLNRINYLKVK